ncbi:MAG: DUF4397 domain-containing protein [Anaerolinea sp.]|nr:DUF4397 domain-containing protein [Anaerolinea sp.]
MQNLKRFTLIAFVLILALTLTPTLGQADSARARFVHAVPGASAIDIYIDGQLAVSSLEFGSATDYIALSAGEHALTVTTMGESTALWEQPLTLANESAVTLVASSISPLQFNEFVDDLNPLPLGKFRFTAVHAVADAPAVDVILEDGRPVVPGLQYNEAFGTFDLTSANFRLAVVPEGAALADALIPVADYPLASSTSYMALVYGTAADPQIMLLSAPVQAEIVGGSGRFIHAVPDAPAVDIYLNETLIAPALAFGNITEYMALPSGDYSVAVRLPGETSDLATGTLSVTNGSYVTAAILGSTEAPLLETAIDPVSASNPAQAVVEVINAQTEVASVSASLQMTGAGILTDVASGALAATVVNAAEGDIILGVTTGSAAGVIPLGLEGVYGGTVYTVIVTDGGELAAVDAASVARSLASAPVASEVVAAPTEDAGVSSEVVAPTEAVAPTEVVAAPTEAPAVVQPTAAPVLPTETPVAPPVVTESAPVSTATPAPFGGPTARILLDPGANLHLRQYPRADALSLGLAPSGTVLQVIGREGAPGPVAGLVPTPTTTPYVDPATLLEDEDADLEPAQTWLYVTYFTPDGGAINAWVNAQFLAVNNPRGEEQRLADLPTVPSNRYGEAVNTAIQPPSARENPLTVTIVGVDPSANVHIRRTASSDGESLARVPNGTVLDFIGLNEERDWAYVRYRTTDGGSIRGWVSTQFVSYQRNSQPVTLDELETRNELETIDDAERGAVEVMPVGVTPTATPLRDTIVGEVVNLDAGANLQFRRNPRASAESLGLVPNGTILIIEGQATDSEGRIWLLTNYQGQDGWVWSQYIRLTFNGRPYDLEDVPLAGTPAPAGTVTPGASSGGNAGGLTTPSLLDPSGGATPVLPGSGL